MSGATDWWAWDGENFHYLGEHANIEDAFEVDDKRAGPMSNWVFSRESLEDLRRKLDKAVGCNRREPHE